MAVNKITIDKFLLLAITNPVLDVRSPGEYAHAHIPSAVSLPLFNDEERAKVGTTYKQQSREDAIKIGLDFFGPNMRGMVERVEEVIGSGQLAVGKGQWAVGKEQEAVGKEQGAVCKEQGAVGKEQEAIGPAEFREQEAISREQLAEGIDTYKKSLQNIEPCPLLTANCVIQTANCQLPTANCVLLHCWRGGMRSAAVAWLLDLYGFKVYTLIGGYKAYRNWVLEQFSIEYNFKIIGGYTGSGKTLLLHALAKENHAIIDLEGLANHKGSALGALGNAPQPKQEMFENLLAYELAKQNNATNLGDLANCPLPTANCIFLEDESQRIGNTQIPMPLWYCMRKAIVYFIDISFEERLNYLTAEYGIHPKEQLVNAIMRIQKRLGGLETKNAINFLLENNFKESFRILLNYYDKYYLKGLKNRDGAEDLIKNIPAEKVDIEKNVGLIKKMLLTV